MRVGMWEKREESFRQRKKMYKDVEDSMLLLDNYASIWLELSARQEVVGDKVGRGIHTHTYTHIQSFWTRVIKATL